MSESQPRQQALFGEREATYGTVDVPNAKLQPFVRLVSTLANECRLEVTDDGLHVAVVDSANVGMMDVTLEHTHDADPATVGVNVKQLQAVVSQLPRDREVSLTLQRPWGTVSVTDDWYNDHQWTVTERVSMLEADMVRESADIPDDLEQPASVTVPVSKTSAYLQRRNGSNAIELTTEDGTFRLAERAGSDEYVAIAEASVDADADATALFPQDYLEDAFGAFQALGLETVRMQWGEEFPVAVHFDTGDGVHGQFFLAPRITSE